MIYKQKKLAFKTQIELKEEYFDYSYEDEAGGESIKVNYLNLPEKEQLTRKMEKNVLAMVMSAAFIMVGIVQLIVFWLWKGQIRFSAGTIGLLAYVYFIFSKTHYSVIKTVDGRVSIMQDKQHDEILNAIYTRRNKALRKIYATIDPNISLEEQKRKFEWLLEKEIITKNEYDDFIDELSIKPRSNIENIH